MSNSQITSLRPVEYRLSHNDGVLNVASVKTVVAENVFMAEEFLNTSTFHSLTLEPAID